VVEIPVASGALSPEVRESHPAPPGSSDPSEEEEEDEDVGGMEDVEDVADRDREWIKSFQPGGGWGTEAGGPGRDRESLLAIPQLPPDDSPMTSEPWVPSPEQVVWTWPRVEDRMAEELD